ncbi:alpha/beta fold hydrolase [Acidimicrobiaceae bacterium USS-CC1]|uniref:Alpha/beta fold hydrolase n=1 Tax=Acidiferrimicrobium australe TaxID=2664430 RepID=A0ABW9QWE6_9ACTN|nr:alpha/beta fold hydrolase [Acidiferrimicrobium australe]
MSRRSEIVTNGPVTVETYLDGRRSPVRGQDVLVLPSYGRDGGEDFDPLAAALAAAGHSVFRPQPRGIAGSSGPMEAVTMEDLADDVAAVIDQLGHAPAVVVGHAFGNWVARVLATNHPDKVGAVILAAASGRTVDPEVNAAPFRAGDLSLPDHERLAALRLAFFAPGHDPSVWLSGWHPTTLTMQHEAVKRLHPAPYRDAGNAPILEIIAEYDPFHTRGEWGDLRAALGDRVTTTVIADAGHTLFPEQPDTVAETIIGYLSCMPERDHVGAEQRRPRRSSRSVRPGSLVAGPPGATGSIVIP